MNDLTQPPFDWSHLATEARSSESQKLDTLPSEQVVSLLLEEDRRGIEATLACTFPIAQAAEWAAECLSRGGQLRFIGAGTSGRLGVLEAAECPPTFSTHPQQIRAHMAGGEDAIFRAVEGAEDRQDQGAKAVSDLTPTDLVIGISASSVTPFVRGALLQADQLGAKTVLLTCAQPAGLSSAAQLVIALDTGPEVLTGSTRLKAGSATKAALNAITTTAMVRIGKVFENLMVDLKPSSAKLRDRGRRIVAELGAVDSSKAEELLEAARWEVKTALAMARLGVSASAARNALDGAGGHLRVIWDSPS